MYTRRVTFLPVNLFPRLSSRYHENSLYEYLKNRRYDIDYRDGELLPITPKVNLVQLLHLENNDPILFLKMHTALKKVKYLSLPNTSTLFNHQNK